MGVAVASGSQHVGIRVPHAKPKVGIVATQGYTNISYGIKGIKLLEEGFSPSETLKTLVAGDPEKELRQVAIMDFYGRKAVFTGCMTLMYHGEIVGEDYIIIGNLLSNDRVLKEMALAFEKTEGDLAWRMIWALKIGSNYGGDRRGERSAALIVVSETHIETELKVDVGVNPIQKLMDKLKKFYNFS
ncbi:MAG: DUF1028 domain-containing protein [Candidatus Bathyarchaeia archaeon]